jgi:serine/threonine protein phosphatase PrpC
MAVSSVTSRGAHHATNQDSFYVADRGRVRAITVYDGHGERGEEVSRHLADSGRLVRHVLGAVAEAGGFSSEDTTSGETAARNALLDADAWVGDLPGDPGVGAGSTAAGLLYDTQSRYAYAFTVGDSLVAIIRPDGVASAMPLQNAALMPRALQDRILELQWRSGEALVGGSRGSSRYMLVPGEPQSGLQVYSTVGDFSVKRANPAVTIDPVVRRWGPLPRGTVLFVATDGYYDGIPHQAYTSAWLRFIEREVRGARGDPRRLVSAARARGSRDDVTVLVSRT